MELQKRKSPRIPEYDYGTPNYYFITICTHNKECLFGSPGMLNNYGILAEENLLKIPQIHPKIQLDKYVVMPNHIHGIFVVSAEKSNMGLEDLSIVIGQYKMSVTKQIRRQEPDRKVWQRSFHDHIIRSQKGYEKIWMYIEDNPRKWKEDCFYCNQSNSQAFGRVNDPPLQGV